MIINSFIIISIFQYQLLAVYFFTFSRTNMAFQLPNRDEVVCKDYTYQGCPLPGEDDHRIYITRTSAFITYGWWNENTKRNDYSITTINLPPNFCGEICSLQLRDSKWVVDIFKADRQTYVTYDLSTREIIAHDRLENPITDEDLVN